MPANTPRLETERLVLRRFTPADVEPLFSLMRDREVNTFLPPPDIWRSTTWTTTAVPPAAATPSACGRTTAPSATSMWTTGRAMIWATPWPGHPGAAAT